MTEQCIETLDDAGCVIANKNIQIDELKSALREAKEALLRLDGWLEARHMGGLTPDENQTIATINAALGSE